MTVVDLPCLTRLKTPPTKVLATAAGAKLSEVIVIGRDQDGDLYFNSSSADGGDVLWLMEIAKRELMAGVGS